MQKKIRVVLISIALVICILYLIQSVFNFISVLEVSSEYSQNDFVQIISKSTAYFGFMITLILWMINILYVLFKTDKMNELLTKVYKPIAQIVLNVAVLTLAVIVYYFFNTSFGLVIQTYAFTSALMIITVIINVNRLNKNRVSH
ncbi:hypothetical protein BN85408080 [Alteracholeplasma palmae J233]|uniref:Uncharacterized protein n=1 Tax=Alteracholeplasma palmae (strain ATCC 49389 / J233) TaxID=1318466 RepID=U4KQ09_ALTPJ|nr:hypothetical protein [Alteracholeplasma palmae]CCV64385.1 hypothetical protein BN85408080 [Alteracholeplasma palmae J233]